MKSWDTACYATSCAYDYSHRIATGERVGIVQCGTIRKTYCAACARARHGFSEDTGEVLELSDAPSYPRPLKALAEKVAARFDARAAAARNDE